MLEQQYLVFMEWLPLRGSDHFTDMIDPKGSYGIKHVTCCTGSLQPQKTEFMEPPILPKTGHTHHLQRGGGLKSWKGTFLPLLASNSPRQPHKMLLFLAGPT